MKTLVITDNDGEITMNNSGFNRMELIGLGETIKVTSISRTMKCFEDVPDLKMGQLLKLEINGVEHPVMVTGEPYYDTGSKTWRAGFETETKEGFSYGTAIWNPSVHYWVLLNMNTPPTETQVPKNQNPPPVPEK
jgi:hypothetical protein